MGSAYEIDEAGIWLDQTQFAVDDDALLFAAPFDRDRFICQKRRDGVGICQRRSNEDAP